MSIRCRCTVPFGRSFGLLRQPSGVAPWQVRRAEQYIEAHWDQPITVEALVIATGVSARSLFHFFKQSRGYSPMAFLKRIRLRHAKQLLTSPRAGTSVTEIAFGCGFGNLGHFSKDYFRSFGELPSQALNRAKGESLKGIDRAIRPADRVGWLGRTTQVQGHSAARP